MIWRIIWFFIGFVRCSVPEQQYEQTVIALFPSGIRALYERKKDGRVFLDFKKKDHMTALGILRDAGVEAKCEHEHSLLLKASKYKKRPGLAVGMMIIILAVVISGKFLWSIELVGLENVDELRALELLEEHGVYVGCYTPSLKLREIYNEILIDSDEFSWISVNIRGTHAVVEVRETKGKTKLTPQKGKCANLVSMQDARVTAVRTYSGESVVAVNDAVRKGELLISGIYEDKMGRGVCTYAQGEVLAEFKKEFIAKVPLEYEKKSFTGEKTRKISVKIFSKTINIFNFSRNTDTKYDIIIDNERVSLFGILDLPLTVSREVAMEYTVGNAARDEAAARQIAYAAIGKEMLSLAGDGEILSAEYKETLEDGVYVLCADVSFNADIAKVQEFVYNEG